MRPRGFGAFAVLLTLAPLACATAGSSGGFGGGDDGGGQADTSQPGPESGASADSSSSSSSSSGGGGSDGSSSSSSSSGGAFDGGGSMDTGGPPIDSGGGGCSLTSMSPCAMGAECCLMNNAAVCMCVVGTGTQGATCTMSQSMQCGPGYACIVTMQGATTGTCYAWCAMPNGSCPQGTTCMALQMPPVINGVTYGFCH